MPVILVVEPDPSCTEQISRTLRSEGWDVDVTANCSDGRSRAESRAPSLVLASGELPDVGPFLSPYSKQQGGPGAVVLLPQSWIGQIAAADLQADEVLGKPFVDADLVALARRYLGAATAGSDDGQGESAPAAEPASPQSPQMTSADLFGDLLAEVEKEARRPLAAEGQDSLREGRRRPRFDDIDRKLEQTLSGVLDLGSRTSRADGAEETSDIDELLDKTLSSLEIPRRRPRSETPTPEPLPVAPAAPAPPAPEPPAADEPQAAAADAEPDLGDWAGFEPPPDLAFEDAGDAGIAEVGAGESEPAAFDAPFEPTAAPAAARPIAAPPPEPRPAPVEPPPPSADDDAFRTQLIPAVKPKAAPAKGDGPTFGDYTLLERIAVGGMAEVWKARRRGVEGFQKTVAIKKILAHLTGSPDFVTMFIDEAKLAAQLSHANIIQIYDLGKVGDDFFIAMEYVDGRDLRTILQEGRHAHRPLPSALALMIAGSVARALDYAHRKRDFDNRELGLVHRDVSPQNVLISYEGEIKLCDFGIVKAVVKASTTQMGALKGKLQYMSPEQAWGKPVDARSDIFSLGAVLFEMLTGQKLFTGDSELSVLDAVRECRIRRPREVAPGLAEPIERIVLKALAKSPEDRYPTAGELEEDIKAFLLGLRPVPTPSDLADYLHRLFVDAPAAPAAERPPTAPAPEPVRAPPAEPFPVETAPPPSASEEIPAFEPPLTASARPVAASGPRAPRPELGAAAQAPPRRGRGKLVAAVVAAVVLGILAVVLLLGRKDAPPSEPPVVAAPAPAEAAPAEPPAAPDEGTSAPPAAAAEGDGTASAGEAADASGSAPENALPTDLETLVDEAFSRQAEEINQDFEAKKKALEKELAAAREAAAKNGGGGP